MLNMPNTIRPKRYDLRLSLEPAAATFNGKVRIEAVVFQATDRVVLHALDLAVTNVTVNGQKVDLSRLVLDQAAET